LRGHHLRNSRSGQTIQLDPFRWLDSDKNWLDIGFTSGLDDVPGRSFYRAIIGFGDPSGVDHAVGTTEGFSPSTGGEPVEPVEPVELILLVGGDELPPVLGT
jgi:hypothetical protein